MLYFFVAVLLATGVVQTAAGQEAEVDRPLFSDSTTLHITLEGPFRQLYRQRHQREEVEGRLRYVDTDGAEVTLDLGLRPRGNSRLDICSFPPLRLNFRRRDVADTVFAGQDRLKLVTLCKERDSYRDYLAQEYQVYRAYRALSEQSYRVRWLSIEYIDTDARRPTTFTEHAFLMEADWAVAERIGMELLTVESLQIAQLDARESVLSSLFQFMIGNTDWSSLGSQEGDCCHNGIPFGPEGTETGRVVIPYDFDQAGVVDADHAEPPAGLSLRNVRQRLYRGYCGMNAEVDWAIAQFELNRRDVEGAFDTDAVSQRARERALNYMRSGYEILANPAQVEKDILGKCRG